MSYPVHKQTNKQTTNKTVSAATSDRGKILILEMCSKAQRVVRPAQMCLDTHGLLDQTSPNV